MHRGAVIFYGPNGSQHVTIYLSNGQMLEAPDVSLKVRVAPVHGGMTPYVVRPSSTKTDSYAARVFTRSIWPGSPQFADLMVVATPATSPNPVWDPTLPALVSAGRPETRGGSQRVGGGHRPGADHAGFGQAVPRWSWESNLGGPCCQRSSAATTGASRSSAQPVRPSNM